MLENKLKLQLVFLTLVSAYSEIRYYDAVEMRWDFSSCGKSGRYGPSQTDCDATYEETSLEGDVTVKDGVQHWTVPTSGLYLITARGPSGAASRKARSGKGAVLKAEFSLNKGEVIQILVGQQSDYSQWESDARGSGGSGGTFVTTNYDVIMLVAGGGSSASGRSPAPRLFNHSDASLTAKGNPGSHEPVNMTKVLGDKGGKRGPEGKVSSAGGGAGMNSDGEANFLAPGAFPYVNFPTPAVSRQSMGVGDYGPGVGGFFSFQEKGVIHTNNGGFGGGGAGSYDGGSGGGGGWSGGDGGPGNGWGGGGGSLNNGETKVGSGLHHGKGSVTISYIGTACCGPYMVYAALAFICGMIVTAVVLYNIHKKKNKTN